MYPELWEVDVFNNKSKMLNEPIPTFKDLSVLEELQENYGKSNTKISDIGLSREEFIYIKGLGEKSINHIVFRNDNTSYKAELDKVSGNYFESKVDISQLPIGKYTIDIISIDTESGQKYLYESNYYFTTKDSVEITLENQDHVEKNISSEFINGEFTIEEPLIKINPYNNSPLTAIVLFETDKDSKVNVKIKGKKESLDISHHFEEVTKEHIIPIYGLYGGFENEVVFDIIYEDGSRKEVTHYIETEIITDELYNVHMEVVNETDSDGLLTFFEGSVYFAVDKEGDIRWYFNNELIGGNVTSPIRLLKNGNISMISETIIKEPYYSSHVYEMNYLGKIYNKYEVLNAHHEIVELPNGNLLIPSKNPNRDTEEDYSVEIDRETGEVIKAIDLYDILNIDKIADKTYVEIDMYKQNISEDLEHSEILELATKAGEHDWFHLNAISYDNGNIILSGRHQDMVVSIGYETEEVNWILTDPSDELPSALVNKLLTPVGESFEYSYGQHAVIYENGMLTLYDNGNFRSKDPNSVVSEKDNYSRGVVYKVNEHDMTVEQVWEFGKEADFLTFTPYIGDIDVLGENHYLINFGGLIIKDGVPISDTFAAFFGEADSYSRIVEIKDDEIIMNIVIESEGYGMKSSR